MLILSEAINRTLERIEKTIMADVEKEIRYPITVAIDKKAHTGPDATSIQLQIFQEFKKSLENGINPVIRCYDAEREEAMLELIDRIWAFYEPFTAQQILNIKNSAIIEDGLKQRLEKFRKKFKEDKVAEALTNFFNDPCASSWDMEDSSCGLRIFKLVPTLEEYKKILERESVKDIAPKNSKKCLNIRLGFSRIEEEQVIQEKGLVNDYRRFCDKYKSSREAQKYKLWYDICEKGIYYVYIPKV